MGATVSSTPDVDASIAGGTTVTAGRHVVVRAEGKADATGAPPLDTFTNADVNLNNDTIDFDYALSPGEIVTYENNGNTSIGGLGDGREYSVLRGTPVAGGTRLTLGASFAGSGVNNAYDTITFAVPHRLVTGDAVRYEGANNGSVTIGLANDNPTDNTNNPVNPYYVRRIDDYTIKLFTSAAEANPATATGLKAFTPGNVSSTNNTITTSGTAYVEGTAVTYRAPAPKTFSSLTVNVQVNGNNKIVTSDTTADGRDNPTPVYVNSLNRIYIATLDNNGNPIAGTGHGFQTGDAVRYNAVGGSAITGLTSGNTYYVIKINDFLMQLSDTLDGTNGNDPDIDGDIGVTPREIDGDISNTAAAVVHTLVKTSQLPIKAANATGGELQDGRTYYVRAPNPVSGTQTFSLSETPTGALLDLDTTGLDAAAGHRIALGAVQTCPRAPMRCGWTCRACRPAPPTSCWARAACRWPACRRRPATACRRPPCRAARAVSATSPSRPPRSPPPSTSMPTWRPRGSTRAATSPSWRCRPPTPRLPATTAPAACCRWATCGPRPCTTPTPRPTSAAPR